MISTAQKRNNHGLKLPLLAAATAGRAKIPAPQLTDFAIERIFVLIVHIAYLYREAAIMT
jgi:hypothetical protein